MYSGLLTFMRYTLSAILGAFVMFLVFASELSKGVEITADGKKVLCIRTE